MVDIRFYYVLLMFIVSIGATVLIRVRIYHRLGVRVDLDEVVFNYRSFELVIICLMLLLSPDTWNF